MLSRRLQLILLSVAVPASLIAQNAFKPTPQELAESYKRADAFPARARDAIFNLALTPSWAGENTLTYRRDSVGGMREFVLVDTAKGTKSPAFDHQKVADALKKLLDKPFDSTKLPIENLQFANDLKTFEFDLQGDHYQCTLETYAIEKKRIDRGGNNNNAGGFSPDRSFRAAANNGKIVVTPTGGGSSIELGKDGGFTAFRWAPDSKHLVGFRLIPGEHREAFLTRSSAPASTRAELRTRLYDQPGDKLDTYEIYIFDHTTKSEVKVAIDPIMGGGQPWSGPPGIDWRQGGKSFVVDYPIRGYQQYLVDKVDLESGKVTRLVDEKFNTFVDVGSVTMRLMTRTNEIIWRSERDGWGHLYLIDGDSGAVKNQITKGEWLVRSIEWIDENKRELCFSANARDNGSAGRGAPLSALDPYFIRYYRIGFDGKGLIELTPGPGTHTVQWSPDRKFYVDTYSRIDFAPVHELRRTSDGKLVTELEKSDAAELQKRGVILPEVFMAKGRDGVTDIWGIIVRPSNFDPKKSYPVIENIYAGPHDSHVPKRFFPTLRMQSLAELGFIVVQIDGMGTRNRGKKFHDVCWKNIADAGFPDRILWMQEMAKKYPQADITRVGIYGTSAGGQNSTGALLFHPEFYKVAVSSCGCHDNRMDKMWWNEQWMGYPVGPHYAEQSNITNAGKLQGKLMLMVGELDTNVPPESTYKLCDALIRARKEFEFVIIPGSDHTDGGVYGERKRRDFFVKNLLGVDPPNWNLTQSENTGG